ncbi:haloacid dehalogenase, partial [Micromonospora azadirachtae]
MSRERAMALLVDFDGVLRRWDPAVAAGVEQRYGLAGGVLLEIAMQWGRLQPVLTGQVSHADWMTSVADALTEPA